MSIKPVTNSRALQASGKTIEKRRATETDKRIAVSHRRALPRYEKRFAIIYAKWMRDVKRRVLGLLKGSIIAAPVVRSATPKVKITAEERGAQLASAGLRNVDEQILKKRLGAFMTVVVEDFGQMGLNETSLQAASFNLSDPGVSKRLKKLETKFSKNIDEVTNRMRSDLGISLAEGYELGESFTELGERVGGVFSSGVRSEAYGAKRIAATEVNAASNFGLIEGYDQSELVREKKWAALPGARKTHERVNGQVRKLRKSFMVGGHKAMYPGDPALPGKERINCRCTSLPVF